MRSRFCTLAISLLWAFFLSAAVDGQQATPALKVGYVRFWNMLPPANGTLQVRKAGVPPSEGSLFSMTAYRYPGYADMPIGHYRFVIAQVGSNVPIRNVDIDLKQDTYFTVLIGPKSGTINVEVIDDTNDPKAQSATITIRNYFTGLTVGVDSGNRKIIDGLTYGQSYAAVNFPSSVVRLVLRSKLANGTPIISEIEADLKSSTKATVLFIPDTYGRFRPRLTIDGKNE